MILSTKGRYAVMAMVDLASHSGGKPVGLATIADRQEIPLAYLEQIFARLKKAGLVSSSRGPGGGYMLGRSETEISIADIMLASDEPMKMTRCESDSHQGCMATKERCLTHDLWEGLSAQIRHYLSLVSLEDVRTRRVQQKFPRAHAAPEMMMCGGVMRVESRESSSGSRKSSVSDPLLDSSHSTLATPS